MSEFGWHYLVGTQSKGPVSNEHLLSLLGENKVSRETLVWKPGAEGWKPLGESFADVLATPPPLPFDVPTPPKAPDLQVATTGTATELANRPLVQSGPHDWTDTSPHPWRRYFARMLDTVISGGIVFFLIGVIGYIVVPSKMPQIMAIFDGQGGQFADAMATCFLAIPLNAMFIGLSGTSLGKWLFGVRVLDLDGAPIGIPTALKREGLIWFRGLGLGLPIVTLFTLGNAFSHLKNKGISTWDQELETRIKQRPGGAKQAILAIFGVALWVVTIVALRAMANAH
jgi:uncharacterized RDD family membrane protein YckC